ncbi:MAG: PQQ-binding-like beta-propeller repeat protein [Phycisphaerales bacterium]|nr:PQQ-binding-like beta-propeller repeat protein [Phycisphaerales bacterium]
MRQWRWASVVLAGVVVLASGARGQGRVVLSSDDVVEEEAATMGGFALPKEDSKAIGRLEDFDRYVGKKAWDLAFRTMNSFSDTEGQGMVPAADGFMVPLRRRIAQSLKALPAEGREAYRLFYDAEARQLWEKLQTEKMTTTAELQALQKIVTQYFLTSVGDMATDRLGDIYFEQGDFRNAARAWQQVLQDYPDTHLSMAKLAAKRCLALWRQGSREELAAAIAYVKQRYAGQMVTFGGKEMEAGAFVDGLQLKPEAEAVAESQPAKGEGLKALKFSAEQKPLWQVRAVLPESLEQMDQKLRNMGWSSRNYQFKGLVPAAAADEKRVYVNWLGVVYTVDIETGKMLWRTAKFTDISANPENFFRYGIDLQRFGLAVMGEKVFAIAGDPRNGGDGPYQVQCFNAETGKLLWKGDSLWTIPYVMNGGGGTGYSLGSQRDETMYLKALNMETGKEEWKVALGKPQGSSSYRGYRDMGSSGTPALMGAEGMIYVATNNGALVAVSTAQRRVEWALKHETKTIVPYNRWGGWDEMGSGASDQPVTLLMDEGILYVKDSGGSMLYAVDLSGPKLRWKRTIDGDSQLLSVNAQQAYILGQGTTGGTYFAMLDLKNRDAIAWSEYLGTERTSLTPLMMKDHVYFLTATGIVDIDPTLPPRTVHLRSTTRWGDREVSGGRLLLTGNKLISVTDLAVSAYEMKSERIKE